MKGGLPVWIVVKTGLHSDPGFSRMYSKYPILKLLYTKVMISVIHVPAN